MSEKGPVRRIADAVSKRALMSGAEPREVRGWEEPLEEQQLEPEPAPPEDEA